MENAVDQLRRALDATAAVIGAIRDDQWAAPTPCRDWRVRDVVNHLVGGHRGFAAVLSGEPRPDHVADQLGDDPVGAYRRSGEALLQAFSRPGVMEAAVTVPAGTVPGVVAWHLRLTEALVHGWDLARATGQPVTGLPADLAEQELGFSRVQMERLPPGRRPFAPSRPVADDAPAIDRLVALLGRAPDWSAAS
jgi:uncharacterized protein (TIGR03086 family)